LKNHCSVSGPMSNMLLIILYMKLKNKLSLRHLYLKFLREWVTSFIDKN